MITLVWGWFPWTWKGHRELSGEMGMFCVLVLVVVIYVCTDKNSQRCALKNCILPHVNIKNKKFCVSKNTEKKKKLEKYEKVKLNGGCPPQSWPQSSEIPVTCFSFGSVSRRTELRPCYILQQQTTCHWIYVKQCFQAFPTVLHVILSQNFAPFESPPMYSPISPELLKHSPSHLNSSL